MKIRHVVPVLLVLAAALVLAACNTVEGLGKDTKKLGEKIETKAADNK
jgi:predicted small secreted protein